MNEVKTVLKRTVTALKFAQRKQAAYTQAVFSPGDG